MEGYFVKSLLGEEYLFHAMNNIPTTEHVTISPPLNEKILLLCHLSCHIGYIQAQLRGKELFVQMMEKTLLI